MPAPGLMRLPLHWQIAIALALAITAGALVGPQPWFLEACAFVGTLFLNALKMLIVPLIVASMIHAILGLPDARALTRLGGKTAAFFAVTTLISVVTGLVLIDLIEPGRIDGRPAKDALGLVADSSAVLSSVRERGGDDIVGVFLRMVPPNLFQAAAEGEMLGLIFFSLVFGFFAARLTGRTADVQREFWGGLYDVMIRITGWIMRFAPIGVFALVGRTVAVTGWGAAQPLILFFFAVLTGLLVQAFVTLPLILRLFGVPPVAHLRAMTPVLLTAFSTSSSAATLPVTFECVTKRAGVPDSVAGFVLPLGCTVNMNGTALYECAAALFIAQAYGLDLGYAEQALVVILALVTSIGVAGIPSASLVAIAVILSAIGLPLEGVGLILAVDRVLDMCRTAVNVYGDTVAAAIIARFESPAHLSTNARSNT